MYIENGDTLVVKSGIEFYEKERTGLKCNTIRNIGEFYYEILPDLRRITKSDADFIKYIRIVNGMKPLCSFKRIVTDISYWRNDVIISWSHRHVPN